MSLYIRIFVVLMGLAIFFVGHHTSAAQAQAVSTVTAAVMGKDATGAFTLTVTGVAATKQYLGASFYPVGVTDLVNQGTHLSYEVPKGAFKRVIYVPKEDVGGTWELMLWGKKVPKELCETPGGCAMCKRVGYHMEVPVSTTYKTGYVK